MSTIQIYLWPVSLPYWDFTPRQIPQNFRINSFQLYQPFAQTAFRFSFVPHTISLWNSLHPEQVAGSYLSFTIDCNVFVLVLLLLRWLWFHFMSCGYVLD